MKNFRELPDVQQFYVKSLIEAGQKVQYTTEMFGKPYVWLKDPDSGKVYCERLPDDFK